MVVFRLVVMICKDLLAYAQSRFLARYAKKKLSKKKTEYIPGVWEYISHVPFPLPPSFTAPSYYIINTKIIPLTY